MLGNPGVACILDDKESCQIVVQNLPNWPIWQVQVSVLDIKTV